MNKYDDLLENIRKTLKKTEKGIVGKSISVAFSEIAHDMKSCLSIIKTALENNLPIDNEIKLLNEAGNRNVVKLNNIAESLSNYSQIIK